MPVSIPWALDEVTSEWLNQALEAGGKCPGAKVASLEQAAIGEGAGFMGSLAILNVTYQEGATGPATMVAKLPTPLQEIRDVVKPFRVFEREVRFYNEAAPLMPVKVPICYFGGMDIEADRYILLLEDLAPAVVGDQLATCSVAEAELALRGIAKAHATFWESPRLRELDWMPRHNDPIQRGAQDVYQDSWPKFVEYMGDRLPSEMIPIGDRFATNIHSLQDRFVSMPNTIQHADFRLDNIFFGEEDGTPSVAIIDWQASTRGGGGIDTGYFISHSLSVDERRRSENALLRAYYDTLLEHGVADYSFEQCQKDYKVGVLWGWIVPVFAVANLDLSTERSQALFKAWSDRGSAAILDHRAGDLLG
ncbi:MAG TPA: oxidoreductase family protein [Dehalococcoidia bacterium]|nr:oxidoreductase family protein [Dehalococcoidia bacterium]